MYNNTARLSFFMLSMLTMSGIAQNDLTDGHSEGIVTIVPESQSYKTLFQRLKDKLVSPSLTAKIFGNPTKIDTSTSCDPKTINKIINVALPSEEDQKQASCTCCVVKEMARRENYQNSILKCQNVSKYCTANLPFEDEAKFFEQTQILSLNQSTAIDKLKIENPEIVESEGGVQDIEHLRYVWNLPHFYLAEEFTPATYKLKFSVAQGYTPQHPNNLRTSTNVYNHHYNKDAKAFFNPWPHAAPPIAIVNAASGVLGALDIKKAQRPWMPQKSYQVRPSASISQGIRATMIGHASVLLQMDNINVLTDPLFYDIGLAAKEDKTITAYKRVKSPGIPPEWLPKIHFVLISHSHMDHFDVPSLKNIEKQNPDVQYITPLGYTKLLHDLGINTQGANRIFELDWWDSIEFPDIRVTALPTQHWSGRGVTDANKVLWSAFAIKTRPQKVNPKYIYFAGDTGFGPHFDEIAKKFPYFDLAMIPLGAYCPMHKEGGGHINPHEAVKVHQILKAKQSMGIHFDTYQLAQEPFGEAERILQTSLKYNNISPEKFIAPDSAEFIDIAEDGSITYTQNP